jgi:hypothetical protein
MKASSNEPMVPKMKYDILDEFHANLKGSSAADLVRKYQE